VPIAGAELVGLDAEVVGQLEPVAVWLVVNIELSVSKPKTADGYIRVSRRAGRLTIEIR
jgi:hypothetical protein